MLLSFFKMVWSLSVAAGTKGCRRGASEIVTDAPLRSCRTWLPMSATIARASTPSGFVRWRTASPR
jgi:hypothetical protein